MRQFPEVRALCAKARRPIMQMVVGTALIVPAAGMMASTELGRLEAERAAEVAAAQAAEAEAARVAAAQAEVEQRQRLVANFAEVYDIPVDLAEEIHEAAEAEQIAPQTAFGLVAAESSFRTQVVSPVGAVGLTQLLPSTARWLVPGTTRSDLMEPETNLRVGFKYLRHLIERFDGNEELALTAYNRGPGTVSKLLRRGRNPDNGYADKVLTGESKRHVALMNAKFGGKRRRS
jgi:soluble lytic murein transglycosylase-like protein